MNLFQTNLFNDLMALCAASEAFYFVDQVKDTHTFRIFSYRIASYTEFQNVNATECRGHTFIIDANGTPLALASMPMQKFWNLFENPNTLNLDLSDDNIEIVMEKCDGSLISTVSVGNTFTVKSKTSLFSEQARAAWNLLNTLEYSILYAFCEQMARNGFTVNLEYMSQTNRIVIGYDKSMLRVLNVRNNATGEYMPYTHVATQVGVNFMAAVLPERSDWGKFIVNEIPDMVGIEGFVVVLKNGTWFKVKTTQYCVLHKTKDSISSERKLFEACVMETADDLRGLFKDDQYTVNLINSMETKVSKLYNHISVVIEKFYNENKHLDRKTYAILGQNTNEITDNGVFGLVMNAYVGKPYDLKEFMIKNYTKFGIRDITYELPE